MKDNSKYIHGTDKSEQSRLALLNQMTNKSFTEFLNLSGDEIILEVGSGLGLLSCDIEKYLPNGYIVGIEYSSKQLEVAKENIGSNVYFCQGDAHILPFKDNQFDIVFCRYVLEHVVNPIQVLQEMKRVLRLGGKIFVQENNILINVLYPECPNFESIWKKFAKLQDKLGGDALIGKKLFKLLKEIGFQEIELSIEPEIHYPGRASFHNWIENLIGNIQSSISDLQEYELASKEEIDLAITELQSFMIRDDATAIFYWNRAKARK